VQNGKDGADPRARLVGVQRDEPCDATRELGGREPLRVALVREAGAEPVRQLRCEVVRLAGVDARPERHERCARGPFRTLPVEAGQLLDALDESVDVHALGLAAHSLKGSSGSMGAKTMAALWAELEDRARNGAIDGIAALLGQLEDEFGRVREALYAQVRS